MSTIAMPTPTYVLIADFSSPVIRPPYHSFIESENDDVRQDWT